MGADRGRDDLMARAQAAAFDMRGGAIPLPVARL